MNERQKGILTLLIKNPDFKIGNLEHELGLTRRQINYSLDQLNILLEDNNLPSIGRNKTGDFFIPSEIVQILASNNDILLANDDFIGDSERRDIILIYMIISNHFISLDHIIDFVKVSKTTAVKDLKNANEYIQNYGLSIEYNRNDGYLLIGNEISIRKLLSDLLVLWNNRLINLEMISEFFPAKEDQIIHFVSLIEQGLQIKYSAESFKLLVVLLKFTIARINNYSLSINIDNEALTDTSEYSLIKKIIPRKWVSSDEDIQWITLIFLSSNIYKSNLEISEDNIIRKLIENMVESFELRTLINIDNKDDFVNRLYTHIRPAIYRIKFGLSLERYNVKSIINEQKHSILLSLIKDLIKPIEEFIGKNFPNDELQLLSLYFGGQLEDKNQSINNIKPKAVTVCANGLISSSMLKKTLENLFPEFIFLTAISEREFYDYEEDYNIVFSTTVLETQIPQFSVDTLMSKEDQIRLRYNVLKEFNKLDNVENLNQTVEKVLSIIDKHTIVKDRASLVKDIENVIVTSSNSEKLISNYWNPGLTSYLKSDYITKTDKTMAWEEAVRKAALPLLESNSIKVTYIERIIEMIRNTNYMYLGEWMAIPHAESKGDIIKEAISLLIAEKPIIFPGNKKIKMIVPIAITDTTKHLRAMNELSEISLNPYYIDQLVESSETEIYIKIKEMEKIF